MSYQLTAEDFSRFSAQARALLVRLHQGPATNRELNEICFGYRQRLSDLRKAGFEIECEKLGDGLARYVLRVEAPPPPTTSQTQQEAQPLLFSPRELFDR